MWSRFFCLSVYVTMYLNDHQRADFYNTLGMNVDAFDRHVITETNRTTERIFPVVSHGLGSGLVMALAAGFGPVALPSCAAWGCTPRAGRQPGCGRRCWRTACCPSSTALLATSPLPLGSLLL